MPEYAAEEGSSPPAPVDSHNLDTLHSGSAHQISTDSCLQVGFLLTTGVNSAYVLGYSGTIMVPLGWIGGVVGLFLATVFSLYANCLLAKLHEHGGQRHIRYKDLADFIYGKKAYTLTWVLQYVNLFMINTGFIILGGSSIKAVYVLFRDDGVLKLPYCIIIAGVLCAMFAISIPHLSALGFWLGVGTCFSLVYIVVAMLLSIRDGADSPPRDYRIPSHGIHKIFKTIGAATNLVFAFNTGMLPEIQATVRQPVVENMLKGLYLQFTVGLLPMFAITFIGYWAYGASTSTYLLDSVSGPVWLKALANISALFQTVISLHTYTIHYPNPNISLIRGVGWSDVASLGGWIFASPLYEYLDTKFGVIGSALAPRNLGFRIMLRGGYLALNTLVSAALPFLGDFMTLTGAISTIPLTFILANHMYLRAKKAKLSPSQKTWHWINIGFFSAMSLAAFVASCRLISVDSKTYHLFANV